MKGMNNSWIVAVALVALPVRIAAAQSTDSASGAEAEDTGSSAAAAGDDAGGAGSASGESSAGLAAPEGEGEHHHAHGTAPGTETSEDANDDGVIEEEEIDRARSEEEAEAAQAATEPLAWRNSFFSWTMGSTFNTFYRGADLSYNPLYYWTFFLTPRWYLSSNVFFVVNQGMYYEFTDDDSATYNHEPQLYDTIIELRATFVADRFIFIPSFLRLMIPMSKLSQASQRYFNTGVTLTTVVNLPEVASGNLALTLSYRRWWGATNVSLTAAPYPAETGAGGDNPTSTNVYNGSNGGCTSGDCFGDQAWGESLGVDRLVLGLTWNLTPTEGLTVTLSGWLLWDQGYPLLEQPVGTMGGAASYLVDDSRSHWRMFSSYSVQIAYDVQAWLNMGIGISNATNLSPFWGPDGSVLSPFNPNTQVFLTTTITLDGIYETLTAGAEEDGLTPEERQRRRQGLAAVDSVLFEDEGDDEGSGSVDEAGEGAGGAARAAGAF